jgi:hypothetical protein
MFFTYVIEEMGDKTQLIKDYSLHLSASGVPPWLHQPDFYFLNQILKLNLT